MKTNVLLTGGAGFIGSNFLKNNNHDYITAYPLDRRVFAKGHRNIDIANIYKEWSPVFFDCCVHLAATVSVSWCALDPYECIENNVRNLVKLLENAKFNKVKHFVFASSAAVYSNEIEGDHSETSPTIPDSLYGQSKLIGEELVKSYYPDATILRFFNVYGPNQNLSYGAVVPNFLKAAQLGENLVIRGDGHQTRDFVHVDDVCSAIKIAILSRPSGVFNVGSGRPTSVLDLAEMVLKFNSKIKFDFSLDNSGVLSSNADISKIEAHTGWRPKIWLEDGLKLLYEKENFKTK